MARFKCPRCEGYVITDYDVVGRGGEGARRIDIQQCLVCGWEKYIDRNVKAQVREMLKSNRKTTYTALGKSIGVKPVLVKQWAEELEEEDNKYYKRYVG